MCRTRFWLITTTLACLAPISAVAQTPVQSTAVAPAQQTLRAEQLDALLAPVALYSDELLAQVLMASTYPLEVVEANRWARQNKALKGETLKTAVTGQSWDDSVKGLVAVPTVLDMMSSKLDWMQKLGDAVLAQQPDVMDSIQRLRAKAQTQGKLTTTKQQKVSVQKDQDKQVIVIEQGEPGTAYVPYYDPAVVYGAWPYPTYPPQYFPPPSYIAGAAIATGIAWGTGWAVGRAIINGGFNWGGNNIVVNRNANISNIGNRVGNNTNIANWQHNPEHRQGVRYNNDSVRQKFASHAPGSQNQRLDFRGRGGEQVLRPGDNRPNIGDRRPGGDRPNVGDRRPGGDRPNVANRAPGKAAGQVNRPHRDTGFSNIQPRNLANAHADRGRQSVAARGGAHPNFAAGGQRGGGMRMAGRTGGGRRR